MAISISPATLLPGQKATVTYDGGTLQVLTAPLLHQPEWVTLQRNQSKQGVVLTFCPDVGGNWTLGVLDSTGKKVVSSLTISVPSQTTNDVVLSGGARYKLLLYMGDVVIDTSSYGVPSPALITPATGNSAATDPAVPVGGTAFTTSMLIYDRRIQSALVQMIGMSGAQVQDYISNAVQFTAASTVTANSLFIVGGPTGSARVGGPAASVQRVAGSTFSFYPDFPGSYSFATTQGGEAVASCATPDRLPLSIAAAIASPQTPSTEQSGAVYLGLRAGFLVA